MAAAAICGKSRAHPWDEELATLAEELPKLPLAALLAVRVVLDALLAEGAFNPGHARAAERLRDELSAWPRRLAQVA